MANMVDEETDTSKNTRLEVLVPEDMRDWVRSAAKRHGLSESALVRYLLAAELTRLFGPGWSDPSGETSQDHPGGDQGFIAQTLRALAR